MSTPCQALSRLSKMRDDIPALTLLLASARRSLILAKPAAKPAEGNGLPSKPQFGFNRL